MDGDDEDIVLFPLLDIDNNNEGDFDAMESVINGHMLNNNIDNKHVEELRKIKERNRNKKEFKPLMSLRQRRHSRLQGNDIHAIPRNMHIDIKVAQPERILSSSCSPGKLNWLRALKKIRSIQDPWERFRISALDPEIATRYRYSALKKKWVTDEVQVKMEHEPFNHGAMRACYRLKKLSSFSHRKDWKHAMNYVAKLYMEDVDRDVYFEDVKLQMDAKLWGEEYNRHKPPKKVDIFQMYVLEFNHRPGKPLYHLEHYIEGDYIKYNSNSGFVDETLRLTPQAFSHFTFERSGHQLIVVDIQGVGDLWTDPQIHTVEGENYGDGNLCTRGMALFFHSHVCNPICESLGLSKFDLADNEKKSQQNFIRMAMNAATVVRGVEEMCVSPSPNDAADIHGFLARNRTRTTSTCSNISNVSQVSTSSSDEQVQFGELEDYGTHHAGTMDMEEDMVVSPEINSPASTASSRHDHPSISRRARVRFMSESDDSTSNTLTEEEDRFHFSQAMNHAQRPSCIAHEINIRNMQENKRMEDSILGQIHHDLAKYHELGRFVDNKEERDLEAAMFHEDYAAQLGVMEATLTMAKIYLGLPQDVLMSCEINECPTNMNRGLDYMEMAAEGGDRSAMIHMAQAYETGNGLGTTRSRNYDKALNWFTKAVETMQEDDSGAFDATMDYPLYILKAKMAGLYLSGGFELDKDPSTAGDLFTEAADEAMSAMKGRLANKYYALAEEAWGQVEEE